MDRPFLPKYGTVSQVLLQLVVAIISRVFKLILVKLFKTVYITIRQGAPLGLAVGINYFVFKFGRMNSHN